MDGQVAVSWGPGRIDRFWRGADSALWHQVGDGVGWSEPESLGGVLASPPAVTAWAVDQMEVFAVLADGQLWDRYWDGVSWHAWESLGGELTGDVAASSWGPDRLDVFARGHDGLTWHRWWDGEPLGRVGAAARSDVAERRTAASPTACLAPAGVYLRAAIRTSCAPMPTTMSWSSGCFARYRRTYGQLAMTRNPRRRASSSAKRARAAAIP